MADSPANTIERQLVTVLKNEYSFYQSLYILLDKQRDMIKYERDDKLLDVYAEVERCRRRIIESDEKISAIREQHPDGFKQASNHSAVIKIVNSIVTLIKKNMALVSESENVAKDRYERIKSELGKLKNSSRILEYLTQNDVSPQFVDGKK